MRVLIHLTELGTQKSYILDFGKSVTERDMQNVLKSGNKEAAAILLGYSRCLRNARKFEILAENRAAAEASADFVVGECDLGALV